ncbi:uncharacterized protein G2W53_016805 [Senna tora]|uniref:Uncharacterized protein n=1 Tax=Senna tora TaxID=362788 RepID=A0A834TRL6_9FABA|nr:uncharacterized protein G2W53_016805 [Senna tora]
MPLEPLVTRPFLHVLDSPTQWWMWMLVLLWSRDERHDGHYSSHPYFHLHRAITPLTSASPCCSPLHRAPPPCWSSVVFISVLDLLSAFDSVLATSRTERDEMHKQVKDVAEGMRTK